MSDAPERIYIGAASQLMTRKEYSVVRMVAEDLEYTRSDLVPDLEKAAERILAQVANPSRCTHDDRAAWERPDSVECYDCILAILKGEG